MYPPSCARWVQVKWVRRPDFRQRSLAQALIRGDSIVCISCLPGAPPSQLPPPLPHPRVPPPLPQPPQAEQHPPQQHQQQQQHADRGV